MVVDYKKQGKRNRKKGGDFEREVRADLESKGYIVSKWSNNVKCIKKDDINNPGKKMYICSELIAARHKFNPFNKVMSVGTGFPDFIIYHRIKGHWFIYGVEAKINGYLDQEEKAKCRWLLKNNIFSKIWIANKKKGVLEYENFI